MISPQPKYIFPTPKQCCFLFLSILLVGYVLLEWAFPKHFSTLVAPIEDIEELQILCLSDGSGPSVPIEGDALKAILVSLNQSTFTRKMRLGINTMEGRISYCLIFRLRSEADYVSMMITDLGYTVVTKGLNDSGQYKIRSEDRETLFSSLEDRTTEGRSETTERRQGDGSSVLTQKGRGTPYHVPFLPLTNRERPSRTTKQIRTPTVKNEKNSGTPMGPAVFGFSPPCAGPESRTWSGAACTRSLRCPAPPLPRR